MGKAKRRLCLKKKKHRSHQSLNAKNTRTEKSPKHRKEKLQEEVKGDACGKSMSTHALLYTHPPNCKGKKSETVTLYVEPDFDQKEAEKRYTNEQTRLPFLQTNSSSIEFVKPRLRIRCSRETTICLLYTSPSPRDKRQSRMPSSA